MGLDSIARVGSAETKSASEIPATKATRSRMLICNFPFPRELISPISHGGFGRVNTMRTWVVSLCAALLAVCVAPARAARADERVVVCLGDSLTEGYGLAPEQSYPTLLERMLRERGYAVRVVNAGV